MKWFKHRYIPPPTNKPTPIGTQINTQVNNVEHSQYRELPHKSLGRPYVSYAVGTAGYGAVGGLVGYITRDGLILVGYGLDKLDDIAKMGLPYMAKADEKATKTIEKLPGGKGILSIDKYLSDQWTSFLGRTPEKQAEWRRRYNIPEPQKERQEQIQGTLQKPIEPSHYYHDKLSDAGDTFLISALIVGLAYGAFKNWRRLSEKVENAAQHNLLVDTHNSVVNLHQRIESLEQLLKQENPQNPVNTQQNPPETRE